MLSDTLVWITNACLLGCFVDPGWHVAPECSGINAVKAMVILFAFVGIFRRLSFFKYFFLLLVAVFFAVVQNIIRVMVLLMLDEVLSADAWVWLHSFIGYGTALAAILIMMRVLKKLQN